MPYRDLADADGIPSVPSYPDGTDAMEDDESIDEAALRYVNGIAMESNEQDGMTGGDGWQPADDVSVKSRSFVEEFIDDFEDVPEIPRGAVMDIPHGDVPEIPRGGATGAPEKSWRDTINTGDSAEYRRQRTEERNRRAMSSLWNRLFPIDYDALPIVQYQVIGDIPLLIDDSVTTGGMSRNGGVAAAATVAGLGLADMADADTDATEATKQVIQSDTSNHDTTMIGNVALSDILSNIRSRRRGRNVESDEDGMDGDEDSEATEAVTAPEEEPLPEQLTNLYDEAMDMFSAIDAPKGDDGDGDDIDLMEQMDLDDVSIPADGDIVMTEATSSDYRGTPESTNIYESAEWKSIEDEIRQSQEALKTGLDRLDALAGFGTGSVGPDDADDTDDEDTDGFEDVMDVTPQGETQDGFPEDEDIDGFEDMEAPDAVDGQLGSSVMSDDKAEMPIDETTEPADDGIEQAELVTEPADMFGAGIQDETAPVSKPTLIDRILGIFKRNGTPKAELDLDAVEPSDTSDDAITVPMPVDDQFDDVSEDMGDQGEQGEREDGKEPTFAEFDASEEPEEIIHATADSEDFRTESHVTGEGHPQAVAKDEPVAPDSPDFREESRRARFDTSDELVTIGSDYRTEVSQFEGDTDDLRVSIHDMLDDDDLDTEPDAIESHKQVARPSGDYRSETKRNAPERITDEATQYRVTHTPDAKTVPTDRMTERATNRPTERRHHVSETPRHQDHSSRHASHVPTSVTGTRTQQGATTYDRHVSVVTPVGRNRIRHLEIDTSPELMLPLPTTTDGQIDAHVRIKTTEFLNVKEHGAGTRSARVKLSVRPSKVRMGSITVLPEGTGYSPEQSPVGVGIKEQGRYDYDPIRRIGEVATP